MYTFYMARRQFYGICEGGPELLFHIRSRQPHLPPACISARSVSAMVLRRDFWGDSRGTFSTNEKLGRTSTMFTLVQRQDTSSVVVSYYAAAVVSNIGSRRPTIYTRFGMRSRCMTILPRGRSLQTTILEAPTIGFVLLLLELTAISLS